MGAILDTPVKLGVFTRAGLSVEAQQELILNSKKVLQAHKFFTSVFPNSCRNCQRGYSFWNNLTSDTRSIWEILRRFEER